MTPENFWTEIFITLISGTLLTFFFFLAREKIFPMPDITGLWHLQMKTKASTYNPYKNMVLRYDLMIWREGNLLKGTSEKVYEKSSTGEHEFVGKNRTRAKIEGYIEKNYLGKDRILIHATENGHGRESTNFYDLKFSGKNKMVGHFTSMVANQSGIAICQRNSF